MMKGFCLWIVEKFEFEIAFLRRASNQKEVLDSPVQSNELALKANILSNGSC
jgi:hypothetical protein